MNFDPFKRSISELNKKKAEKGLVLVSEPFMGDDYFKRSVVYLVEHNSEGTIGFMLNKPMDIKVKDLFADFPEIDSTVFLGGPVQAQNLFYIHSKGDIISKSIPLRNGLYWDGDFEELKIQIEAGRVKADEIKFFLGYSGWSETQLDEEIKENSWFIQTASENQILKEDSSNLWKEIIQNAEGRVSLMADFPEDPSLN